MAENRGYGSYQEGSPSWPSSGQSEPRYQPPSDYYVPSSTWTQAPYIPPTILKQAEARVAAQKQFFKHLFIYLGVAFTAWMIGISHIMLHYADITSSDKLTGLILPFLVSVIGGIRVAYSYFLAFIWERRTYQERVMHEVQKIVS